MNTPVHQWSDTEVRAFVDGELDADSATRFTAQVRLDLTLAQRVARERALRARLAGAFNPVLREPVPARLLEAMEGKSRAATPIGASRRAGSRGTPGALWWGAAAAGILAAGFIGWYAAYPEEGTLVVSESGLQAGGMLAEALSQRLSAEGSKERGVLISLSFQAGDGRYCRTFSLDSGLDGLACRSAGIWQIQATGRSPAEPEQASGAYRQASSGLSPAVLAAISRYQAGDALTREQEREVRERDWR